MSYNLLGNAKVDLYLTDMTGKVAKVLFSGDKQGGEYVENYYLEELRSGIYFLQLICENQRITRRILID